MKTLIVGANGFIGSNLSRDLLSSGESVIAMTRQQPSLGSAEWLPATLAVDAKRISEVTTIVWAAGASTPASSAASADAEYRLNLQPLLQLLETVGDADCRRVVFLSTGGAIYGDIEDGTAHEHMAVEPKSYYGAAKASAEAFLTAWAHQSGHDVTILRPSNVYGLNQPFKRGFGIIPTAFQAIKTGTPVVIRGDGNAVRDYLHISDLVSLVKTVIKKPLTRGSLTCNASSNEGTSLNELFAMIQRVTGHAVPCEYQPARPYDVSRIVLDNQLARSRFGWKPKITLPEGIADAWSRLS